MSLSLIQVSIIMRIIYKLFLAGLALAAAPAKACDSTLDIVLDTSGSSGFDKNGDDFDILRELVLLTGECFRYVPIQSFFPIVFHLFV